MIEISSAVLTANLGILIKPITVNGSLEVDTDSLKIALLPKEQYQDTKIYSSYNGEKINGKFVLEKNKYLYIGFEFPKHSYPSNIMILPSNFITCKGKPIITDTIWIQIKNKRIQTPDWDGYQHELHHLWQSRAFGDMFLLNYGLQGIGAMLMGGSFLDQYNYFEQQAYGSYWW